MSRGALAPQNPPVVALATAVPLTTAAEQCAPAPSLGPDADAGAARDVAGVESKQTAPTRDVNSDDFTRGV